MLASNYIGKPFREGFLERMSAEELVAAEIWLDAHFHFIQPAVPTIDSILAGAKALVYRTGAKGIVIDPWNRIRHPGSMNDGDSIARTIGQISEFAHRFRVHVWLVAHPTKLQQGADGKYPTATLNQIAGSYMFEAMADNGISLGEDGEFQILKTRPEEVGKKGTVHLGFHRPTGRFYDPNAPIGVVAGTESLAEWRPSTPRYIGEEGDGWKEEEPQGDIADIIMPFAAADGGD
jgi:twinkle protein